ncbi:hypothetical protein LCGC14_2298350 [marine sediment metagenome]|uniref:Uncharacterized protein n=1 Tax=marine sediment metagenome TaxID=412755 RepID=A0A0F9CPN5_9ZZZZ
MSECEHDLGERETMCADGMCPRCLADDNKSLKDIVSYMRLTMLNAAKERNG